jgi:SWI/SNF chromatin-remodeling complex subunit SWI1
MSPSQSDGSRVNTPQNANFMQAQQFGGMTSGAPQPSMQAPQFNGMQQVPQGYHQALANQQQRLHAMQQQTRMNSNPAMAGRQFQGGIQQANPQQPGGMRQMPPNMQSNMPKPSNPEGFLRSLQKFMMSQNLPMDPNPIVSGRPINLVQLYATVMKMGGSKKVTATNMWPAVAHQLQFPQMQYPTAAQEIQAHHSRNLGPYEQAFISSQQKQMTDQMQQQQQQPPQQQGGIPRQPSQFHSPLAKPNPGFEQAQAMAQSPQNNTPVHNNVPGNPANGFATPTHARSQSRPAQGHRPSISRASQPPVPPTEATAAQFAAPSPQSGKGVTPIPGQQQPGQQEQKPEQLVKRPIDETFKPMVLKGSRFHGPIAVDEMYQIGEDISRLKPDVPGFAELGVVDIHALTMALKCGIYAEIRVALDTLTTLSGEPSVQISLENCDDLVESLIDCAEDQVELLAQHTLEESDTMHLRSYDQVTRDCQTENTSLANVPEFGSIEYELDRAVDRLICITTILRNFSFSETNFLPLGIPPVAQLFSSVFRYMGTRKMFLRTSHNTLDFMKDAVILLSNLAHVVQIPGKDEALNLLIFLLAFSPEPEPTSPSGKVMFTTFNSSVDRYTPAAVDGLAKMLARDDPNRTYFKAIFSGDGSALPQPELLTRAFGLAISCVPDKKPMAVVDARKVFLMQGLLSADVLTTFADGPLAKAWLESVDGFAVHLLRLSCALCTERIPQINMRQRSQAEADAYAFSSIVNRGLGILRRLAEKSKQVDNTPLNIPSGILPRKESLLGALLLPNIDGGVVRQLLTYARLAE